MYTNDLQDMYKPHSKDTSHHAFYMQGNYFIANAFLGDYNNQAGVLNVYHSDTFKNFCFAYGALGFSGNHTLTTVSHEANDNYNTHHYAEHYHGYGFNLSASYVLSTRHTDYRLIGIDLVYTHEIGQYAELRKLPPEYTDSYNFAQTDLTTYGVFSEIQVKSADTSVGWKISFNGTPGDISNTLNGKPA